MNLESVGFPVHQYSEMDAVMSSHPRVEASGLEEDVVQGQSSSTLDVKEQPQAAIASTSTEAHAVEKKSRAHEDPLIVLSEQVPQ